MDYTWDLSVLYRDFDDPKIESDFAALKQKCAQLQAMCRQAAQQDPDPLSTLEALCDGMEDIHSWMEPLSSFASLTLATEATNERAQQLMDRLEAFSVEISLLSSGITRYIGGLPDLEAMIRQSDKLKKVDFYLRQNREEAAHLMDPAIEEWMLRMSITGSSAFSTLRDKLDATLLVDYRGKQLPLSAVRAMAYDPDPQVRKDAYEAELAAYTKIEIPMAACLNGIKGEALTMIDAQHFSSVLDQTLFYSNMDRETLDAMLTAMDESLPAFRRYMRKKGQLLGHENGLPFYDLFAPLSPEGFTPRRYTIEEARDKLLTEMGKFTPEMAAFIDGAFRDRWIDVFPREGKGGGAFCAGLHTLDQSRVLTNFDGSFSDVSTLAHELGHAWHNRCMASLPSVMTDAPMPLAETASIFNETVLAHAMLDSAPQQERFTILEGLLSDANQTIVDIYSRYLFESAVIDQRKDRTLPAKELKALMLDAQEKTYGDGLDPDCRHPYMWACKSHYYIPGLAFYNFPYAFGQLFSAGVYAIYRREGASFVPRYNQLLRSCGSMKVYDVARSVGIDVRDPDFWRASLRGYTEKVDEFIALADELMPQSKS
ncbi:MAG: M3 family oligoendopeptidase [Clostridia bacterium]|nr:M3 family oligoendopeptidase [Clostridia bacterium]